MVFGVGFAFVFKSVCTCVGGDILGGEEFLLCMQSMGGFERIKLRGYKGILKVETSLEEIIRMVKLKAASFHDLQLQQ